MLTWCTPKRPPTAAEPTVLELRVHGISNTPPESVLDLPTGEIERSRGDDLGSFWTPTAQARERDVLLPPGDRHHIRPDVRREAYSWGAMARLSSVPFVGALGALGRGVTRVLWTLVIPFGLANVAYWSRRPPVGQRGWKQGNGAATIRLFSLALTLLLAASTASVTLGLIGSQCFLPSQQLPADAAGADPVTASLVCSQLPSALQLLAPMRHGQRIALFAVVPVAVVLLLWLVAHSGRVRFDERMSTSKASGPARGGTGDTSAPRSPLLATPGFWSHSLLSLTTGRLHVAAVLVLLTGVLSWEGVFGRAEACRGVSTFLTRACLVDGMGERTPHAGFVVLLVGSAVLMAWIAWRVCVVSEACADVRPGERERRVHSGWLLVVSLSAFGAAEALVWRSADPVDAGAPFTGLVATLTILVGLLFGLAFVALVWRGGLRATLWIPLLVVGGGGITPDALLQDLYARAWVPLALASAALVALAVAVAMALRRSTGAQEGWSGAGPGVFLFLSAGTAMIFSSLVVLGVSRFLNAPAATARLLIPGGYDDAVAGADRDAVRDFVLIPSREGTTIVPPRAYAEFGIATLLILAILVLVLLPPLWHMMRGVPALPNAPSASRDPEDPSARTKTSASVPAQASTADGVTLAARRVLAARRLAATLQRGEKVLGVLAFACGAALLLTLLTQTPEVLVVLADATGVPVAYDGAPTAAIVGSVVLPLPPWVLPGAVEAVATAAVGAAALLVFGSMIAGAATGAARPLGLVWDLICFLPRAAHPFGPPCYAERVVPELRGRIDAWLAGRRPIGSTGWPSGGWCSRPTASVRCSPWPSSSHATRAPPPGASGCSPTARSCVRTSEGSSPSCSVRPCWVPVHAEERTTSPTTPGERRSSARCPLRRRPCRERSRHGSGGTRRDGQPG